MRKFKLINSIIITTLCIGVISISNIENNKNNLVSMYATDKYSAVESIQLSNIFNAKEYLELYPELKILVTNKSEKETEEILFNHFVNIGILEGKQPSKSFNVYAYKSAYIDLQLAFGNDIVKYYEHYINIGYYEGRTITTIEKANSVGIEVTDFNNFKSIKEINHNHNFILYIIKDDYSINYCSCGSFQLIPIHK